jgi:hypothetical protein
MWDSAYFYRQKLGFVTASQARCARHGADSRDGEVSTLRDFLGGPIRAPFAALGAPLPGV